MVAVVVEDNAIFKLLSFLFLARKIKTAPFDAVPALHCGLRGKCLFVIIHLSFGFFYAIVRGIAGNRASG
jgi:hypothetical protein